MLECGMGKTSMLQGLEAELKAELAAKAKQATPNTKRIKVARRYGWACWWCNQQLRREFGWQNSATIEHLVPRSQGGPGEMWNLAAACHRCNLARGTMGMEEFAMVARHYEPDRRSMEEARRIAVKARRRAKNEQQRLARLARMAPPPEPITWWGRIRGMAARLAEYYSVDPDMAWC